MRLFLCEKPSQGKHIAEVLGATQRGDGCLTGDGVQVDLCIGGLLENLPYRGVWPEVQILGTGASTDNPRALNGSGPIQNFYAVQGG